MPVFFTLSQVNAQRMQDMPGGDEARVNFLTTVLGLQLVGRAGLTPSQQALVKVRWQLVVWQDLVFMGLYSLKFGISASIETHPLVTA